MLLKDMNKKSFNFPANVIFERLGGTEGYREFIKQNIPKINENEIEMYNGSGYPKEITVTRTIDGKETSTREKNTIYFLVML